jgi:hypothetical protein
MQFISAKLKRFDVHRKTADGVNDRTIPGALLTIATIVIIVYLLCTNVAEYMQTEETSRMILDSSVGVEDVQIIFSVSFHSVSCKGNIMFCAYASYTSQSKVVSV